MSRCWGWLWQQQHSLCKTDALAWDNSSRSQWWIEEARLWAHCWILQLPSHGCYFVISATFLPQSDHFACAHLSQKLCCCYHPPQPCFRFASGNYQVARFDSLLPFQVAIFFIFWYLAFKFQKLSPSIPLLASFIPSLSGQRQRRRTNVATWKIWKLNQASIKHEKLKNLKKWLSKWFRTLFIEKSSHIPTVPSQIFQANSCPNLILISITHFDNHPTNRWLGWWRGDWWKRRERWSGWAFARLSIRYEVPIYGEGTKPPRILPEKDSNNICSFLSRSYVMISSLKQGRYNI